MILFDLLNIRLNNIGLNHVNFIIYLLLFVVCNAMKNYIRTKMDVLTNKERNVNNNNIVYREVFASVLFSSRLQMLSEKLEFHKHCNRIKFFSFKRI